MLRSLIPRLSNIRLVSNMKKKGGKGKTKAKKHQEDPQPLHKSVKFPSALETSKLRKQSKGDQYVLEKAKTTTTVTTESKSIGETLPDDIYQKDTANLSFSSKTTVSDIGVSQPKRKHAVDHGDFVTNFWEKSREKYQKISNKKGISSSINTGSAESSKPLNEVLTAKQKKRNNKRKSSFGSDISYTDETILHKRKIESEQGKMVQTEHCDDIIDRLKSTKKQLPNKMQKFKEKIISVETPSTSANETDILYSSEVDTIEISSNDEDDQCMLISDSDSDESDVVTEQEVKGLNVIGLPCGVILAMEKGIEFCFHGNCRLQSLCGTISVLGSHLKPDKKYDCYSPNTNSFLTIKCEEVEENPSTIKKIYESHGVAGNKIPQKIIAMVKVDYLDSPSCSMIPKYPPFHQLFKRQDNRDLKLSWQKSLYKMGMTVIDSGPRVICPPEYDIVKDMAEKLVRNSSDGLPVITILGGKNSGKSTMNRYLLNSLLNKVDKVFFLECDVGQTEFTPPGCVSLHCVSEPLLGPPFTHQRPAVFSCFFGGVTPSDDPTIYLTCIEQCFSKYLEVGGGRPLIVNTMGWNSGVGLALTVDTVRLVHPLLLVQINTRKAPVNFPPMSPNFVQFEPGWKGKNWDTKWKSMDSVLDYEWLTIDSPVNTSDSNIQKYKASDHRDLAILSYFSSNLELGMSLTSRTPVVVSWKSVAIHICHSAVDRSQILYAINGTLVALCQAELSEAERDDEETPYFFKTTPVCQCLGYGIVRGIDPIKKELYIITPLPLREMENVNTLMRGVVNLPQQLLIKQQCDGPLPYVTNPITTTGSKVLRQRHHKPRKHTQGNNDQ